MAAPSVAKLITLATLTGVPSSLNVHIQGLVTLIDRDASTQPRRGVTGDFCGIEIQWRVKHPQNLFNDHTEQLPV